MLAKDLSDYILHHIFIPGGIHFKCVSLGRCHFNTFFSHDFHQMSGNCRGGVYYGDLSLRNQS